MTTTIKVGGARAVDPAGALSDVQALYDDGEDVAVVHGGSTAVDDTLERLGIDPEYVETLGSFFVSLAYNVTPRTIEYQTKKLLKWVHPKVHGELETEMARLAKRIQRENVSMYFSPSRILTDTGGDGIPSVAVVGEVTRKVGSTETRREQIAVVMRFTIAAGKVYLTAFYEADDTSNPFGKK